MKRYAAVIFTVTLAVAATGLVSGTNSVTTAPSVDVEADNSSWSPSVENMVTRLVQNGMSNTGVCPPSA